MVQLVATDGDLMFLELRAIEVPPHLGMTQRSAALAPGIKAPRNPSKPPRRKWTTTSLGSRKGRGYWLRIWIFPYRINTDGCPLPESTRNATLLSPSFGIPQSKSKDGNLQSLRENDIKSEVQSIPNCSIAYL